MFTSAVIDGNGFLFKAYTIPDTLKAIKGARASFYHRAERHNLIRRNMRLHFPWRAAASKYEEVYLRAVRMSRAQ